MADLLVDYKLDSSAVANPDGSFPAAFTGASVVAGPGNTLLGPLPKALNLGPGGAVVDLGKLKPDFGRFCIRAVFRADAPVSGVQRLFESDLLPFGLYLSGESFSGDFNLVGAVTTKAHGYLGPDTRFKKKLKAGVWYTVDLAYDTDTAALFLDGAYLGVCGFPAGTLAKPGGHELFIGTGLDGKSDVFDGSLAAFRWYSGIPPELEAAASELRTYPEWFITYKREAVRKGLDLGERTDKVNFLLSSGQSYIQRYQRGAIMYHDGAGAAFALHGPIHDLYFSSRELPMELGYLVGDQTKAAQPGAHKSLFSNGGIYYSPGTGAVPVTGGIYLTYELAGESNEVGLPLKRARALPGGYEQEFQKARMYYKNGDIVAFAVREAILERFLATGGIGTWGFPKTPELPVRKKGKVVGRVSQFEFCTIYWSRNTGAHEVHGDIRARYEQLGGPQGKLGFPTSDEANIPGATGPARHNTFENGSILWFGSAADIVVASPFRVFIGRIDSKEEEGLGQGQNDIYFWVTLKQGGTVLHSERWPSTGARHGHNIVEPKLTLPPVVTPDSPGKNLTLTVDVWDYDSGGGGGNDHLGEWTQPLNMANGWGFRGTNGILDSGPFALINSIRASVKRTVDVASLSEVEKWWGVGNEKTKTITHAQFAKAFRDVDSESELWDVTDWLQKAFYELVIRSIAEKGNCFGLCLESIYARKNASLFGQPLNEHTNWAVVRDEINVKHQYQVGAAAVWWFVGEVLAGNAGNPARVFRRSREAFATGDNPVLCLSRNLDFSGSPHVVLPIGWDDTSKPWRLTVIDPFFPGETRIVSIDPDQNRFAYSGKKDYEGGKWDGGRLYFIPFSVLNERPRTPVWEAILLILTGTVVILGGDAETERIADVRKRDLDAGGAEAAELLAAGGGAGDRFVSFKGLGAGGREAAVRPQGKGTVVGELLLRGGRFDGISKRDRLDLSDAKHRTIEELAADSRFRPLARELGRGKAVRRLTAGRTVRQILADPEARAALPEPLLEGLERLALASGPKDFVHTVSGVRGGKLHYVVKRGLTEFELRSTIQPDERTEIRTSALGTRAGEIRLATERDKRVRVVLKNKLGVDKDFVALTLDKVPVSAAEELQLRPKPGIAGIEMIGHLASREGAVAVEGLVDGKRFERRFAVSLEEGVSLNPSTVLSQNALGVATIAQLFGGAVGAKLIKPI